MKRIIVALLILPFAALAQDNKNGFGKYVFGTAPSEYRDLMLEIDEGDTKLYSSSAPTSLDGVELDQVNVTFCKNKLTCVAIRTRNAAGSKLLATLKQKYGEPKKSDPSKGSYEWNDNHLQLIYEKNSRSPEASATFYSVDLYKAMKKK